MLGRFRMTVSDCLQEFETISQRTFGKPRPASQAILGLSLWTKYSAKTIEDSFRSLTLQRGGNDYMRTVPGTCSSLVYPLLTWCYQATWKRLNYCDC
jgi:hypothetical protein